MRQTVARESLTTNRDCGQGHHVHSGHVEPTHLLCLPVFAFFGGWRRRSTGSRRFFFCDNRKVVQSSQVKSSQVKNYSAGNKSTNSGTMPSVPSNWSSAEDTRVPAKARLQETDSIRHHLFLQARNEENRSKGVASRARETANRSTNESASGLHHPPVSMPTTTSRHRSPAHNSAYFTSVCGGPLPKLLHQLQRHSDGRGRMLSLRSGQ